MSDTAHTEAKPARTRGPRSVRKPAPDKRLAKLREPFEEHHISQKPLETKEQHEARKAQPRLAFRCGDCGGWHHREALHLDYVGHAAVTNRLLEVDPEWNWRPFGLTPEGLPAFDKSGGLWIHLTVCGVTRPGYGNADPKQWGSAGDRDKEAIGDALRNAGMRFGMALDLWHKGNLHLATLGHAGGGSSDYGGEDPEDDPFSGGDPAPGGDGQANGHDLEHGQAAGRERGDGRMSANAARKAGAFELLRDGIRRQTSVEGLRAWAAAHEGHLAKLPRGWQDEIRKIARDHQADLREADRKRAEEIAREREQAERELDRGFDPRTGGLREAGDGYGFAHLTDDDFPDKVA